MENKNRVWKIVNVRKDMPKKSGNYLMLTDMGWPMTFYWDSHERKGYVLALRNKYDLEHHEYVNLGKVDGVKIDFRYDKGFAWTEIPEYDGD